MVLTFDLGNGLKMISFLLPHLSSIFAKQMKSTASIKFHGISVDPVAILTSLERGKSNENGSKNLSV